MNKKKLWIIILVLAVVLVAAIVSLIILGQREESGTSQGNNNQQINKDQYTVTFYSNDGTVLKIDSVEKGNTANPPSQPQMLYGTVFQSWVTDVSTVTENLEVHPICVDVKGKANTFAIEGAYGKSGGTVIVPIRLCGEVCVSAFDMTISYDATALDLISVSEDGAVLYNDEVPGKIKLNYVSTDNTLADVDICFLEFSVKASSGQSQVTLDMNSIYACQDSLESENDDLYVPEYTAINGTVYVLPKGE